MSDPEGLPPERAGLLRRQRFRRPAAEPAERPRREPPPPAPRFHVLAMGTAWRSEFGGLNTLNRELCQALAAAGCRVVCVVDHASEPETADAASYGVRLLVSPAGTVARADLPRGFVPEIVIGHGRVTGHLAEAAAAAFPRSRRLHLVHVAPDEIDPFKDVGGADRAGYSAQRTAREVALGRTAYRVVAVGPVLHGRYATEFAPLQAAPVLRLDPGFGDDAQARTPPPGTSWRVLLFGRAEESRLKGLDIAARATALAARRRSGRRARVEFWVRGAPPGTGDELAAKLRDWSGDRDLPVVVREFTTDPAELAADLHRASVVLMPSRSEGFGLAGLEGLLAGVPTLVSAPSGLGRLLAESLPADEAADVVLPVGSDAGRTAEDWARAIEFALLDRDAAFARATALRARLAAHHTWPAAAAGLLRSL